MNFADAVKTCLVKKYATFSGRACRSEFWYFCLFNIIVCAVAGAISDHLETAVDIALALPMLGASWRRLHDTGRSGWWIGSFYILCILTAIAALGGLLALLPAIPCLVLAFVILFFNIQKGTAGPNRYGEDPLGAAGGAGAGAHGVKPEAVKGGIPAPAAPETPRRPLLRTEEEGASSASPEAPRRPLLRTDGGIAAGAAAPADKGGPGADAVPDKAPKARFCPNCGASLAGAGRFCTQCGARLE